MRKIFGVVCTLLAMLAMQGAQAGGISDLGVNAYWGADNHGYGDVIGNSTYEINGATITRVGSVLTVTIATNFAGHAGIAPTAAPGGIGYGDVFLSQVWNPFGSDANHIYDNSSNSTVWSYGMSLDNRLSNAGGTFKLYKLNGATNAANILNSESFMTCTLGTQCDYRNGQEVAVKTSSSSVQYTGLTGSWSVLADQQLKFIINIAGTDLVNASSLAMHWGETCQNDVIEGITRVVPAPGSSYLLALGLCAMLVVRKRQSGKTGLTVKP